MANFHRNPFSSPPFFLLTLQSHRFFYDQFVSYKLEVIQLNGELYFSIQSYYYSQRLQQYIPHTGLYFSLETWRNFINLANNLGRYI